MYTATAISKSLIKGTPNYRVSVLFTTDAPATEKDFQLDFTLTPNAPDDALGRWVYDQIDDATPKKGAADLIILKQAITPIAPPAPAAPTKEQGDRVVFDAALAKLQRLKQQQAAGLIFSAETIAAVTQAAQAALASAQSEDAWLV